MQAVKPVEENPAFLEQVRLPGGGVAIRWKQEHLHVEYMIIQRSLLLNLSAASDAHHLGRVCFFIFSGEGVHWRGPWGGGWMWRGRDFTVRVTSLPNEAFLMYIMRA